MREWSPAAKQGILGWLESVTTEKPKAGIHDVPCGGSPFSRQIN